MQVDELQEQIRVLTERAEQLEEDARRLEQENASLEANRALWEAEAEKEALLSLLEYHFARGEYDACRTLLTELEPYRDSLNENAGATDAPSEHDRFLFIADAVAQESDLAEEQEP